MQGLTPYFSVQLDRAAVDEIGLALHQSHLLGNARFHDQIEKMTGIRREAKRRGSPRLAPDTALDN
jgi:hypothetical protein